MCSTKLYVTSIEIDAPSPVWQLLIIAAETVGTVDHNADYAWRRHSQSLSLDHHPSCATSNYIQHVIMTMEIIDDDMQT